LAPIETDEFANPQAGVEQHRRSVRKQRQRREIHGFTNRECEGLLAITIINPVLKKQCVSVAGVAKVQVKGNALA
jgi:hypothetical protein